MVWYGKYSVASAVYLPASLAALVAPYALAAGHQRLHLPTTLLGFALAHGALATAMPFGLGMGSGALVASWAVAAVLAACAAAKVRSFRLASLFILLGRLPFGSAWWIYFTSGAC